MATDMTNYHPITIVFYNLPIRISPYISLRHIGFYSLDSICCIAAHNLILQTMILATLSHEVEKMRYILEF